MKKPLSFLLSCALCFFLSSSLAQDCMPNDITLSSQMEVDNFQTNHGACTNVLGNLTIAGLDITNLNGLSGLLSIQGDLRIRFCNLLTNLSGLDNLSTIGGTLDIVQNDVLENLDALSNVNTALAIRISANFGLQNINGLNTLITGNFPGPIDVSDTQSPNLDAFQGLISVAGRLRLNNNRRVEDISGLSMLNSVGDDFTFSPSSSVLQDEEMSPLLNLNTVSGTLTLQNLDGVTNLDFLTGLTNLGGLFLGNNDLLENIDGLNNLGGNSLSKSLALSQNDVLQNVDPLGRFEIIEGEFFIDQVNVSVPDFSGLSNIHTVNGDVTITTTMILTNVDFFCGLKNIGGSLSFFSNSGLESIDGLSNVVSIGGRLNFESNELLEDLDALSGITSLGGDLNLTSNPMLTNIDALSSLSFIDGRIRIRNNPLLSVCCGVSPVVNAGGVTGSIEIADNNATGCQSEQDIRDGGSCDCGIVSVTPVKGAELEKVLVKYVGSNSGILMIEGQSINVDPNFGGKVEVELDEFPSDREITASLGGECSLTVQFKQAEPLPSFSLLGRVLFLGLIMGLTSFYLLKYIKP